MIGGLDTAHCKTIEELYKRNFDRLVESLKGYNLSADCLEEDVTQEIFLKYVNLIQTKYGNYSFTDLLPIEARCNFSKDIWSMTGSYISNHNVTMGRRFYNLENGLNNGVDLVKWIVQEHDRLLDFGIEFHEYFRGPLLRSRFIKDVKYRLAYLRKALGMADDEAQRDAGISHGSFYRAKKIADQALEDFDEKYKKSVIEDLERLKTYRAKKAAYFRELDKLKQLINEQKKCPVNGGVNEQKKSIVKTVNDGPNETPKDEFSEVGRYKKWVYIKGIGYVINPHYNTED